MTSTAAASRWKYGPGTAPARLLQGEPIVEIPDLLESDAYRKGEPNRRRAGRSRRARFAFSLCPLLKDERVVGNVMIFRQEKRRFSEKQISLLQQFADQAVIAIENTRLLRELRERTEDLSESLQQQTATADVLKVISASPGELEPVFQAMLENAVRLCEAKFAMLFSCERRKTSFAPSESGTCRPPIVSSWGKIHSVPTRGSPWGA